jgi:hypothetical protein
MRRGVLVLAVLVLAACGSGGGAKISRQSLPNLVLQPKDLPRGFSQFAGGEQTRADQHPGPRQDEARFGRISGWISRFRRTTAQTVHVAGPLVVESRADLFPSRGDAKKDLDAYAAELDAMQPLPKQLDAPALGDGAIAYRYGSGLDHFVLLAWRKANATASITVEGSSVTLGDAAKLARPVEARAAAAAS